MSARSSTPTVAAVLASAGLMVAASQVSAHARLIGATPAANATVAAPRTIVLRFSEKLVPKFSGAELMKGNGGLVATVSSLPDAGHKTIDLVVGAPLAPGSYMVMWHAAAADDGHRTADSFNFTVK